MLFVIGPLGPSGRSPLHFPVRQPCVDIRWSVTHVATHAQGSRAFAVVVPSVHSRQRHTANVGEILWAKKLFQHSDSKREIIHRLKS